MVRVGPTFVHCGLTDDLERAKIEAQATWPTGQFFQVGDKTTVDEARAWVLRNTFVAKRSPR
jgi:hypothetical protein